MSDTGYKGGFICRSKMLEIFVIFLEDPFFSFQSQFHFYTVYKTGSRNGARKEL